MNPETKKMVSEKREYTTEGKIGESVKMSPRPYLNMPSPAAWNYRMELGLQQGI